MGFWYPKLNLAFVSATPVDIVRSGTPWEADRILPFEFLCVVTALRHASWCAAPDAKIVIFTNSMNTVDMFSSLSAKPLYNPLLRYAIDILIDWNLHLEANAHASPGAPLADWNRVNYRLNIPPIRLLRPAGAS